MELVEQGAIAVLGNHDAAVSNPNERMNVDAMAAIDWTRGTLGTAERRFLAGMVLGSVGEPRNGISAASYATFDTVKKEITFRRVPYDIEGAASAIRKARLPNYFAARLCSGR